MSNRSARPVPDPATLSFGPRLRCERERRQISIATIAEKTKILGALLEGLEREDVSRWPTGLYRRAFIRAYATAIGLDPEPVVKEFLERFPEPVESPAPGLSAAAATAAPATSAEPAVRVGVHASGGWFTEGALVRGIALRCLAAGLDLFLISVMGLALFAVLGVFWAPVSLATAAYYSVSILLLGNTPGVCLFADPQKRKKIQLALRQPRPRDVADSAV